MEVGTENFIWNLFMHSNARHDARQHVTRVFLYYFVLYRNLNEKCRSPEPRTTSSASQRNGNARQHATRAGNLPENVPKDVTQIVPAQDVKTTLSCEASPTRENCL